MTILLFVLCGALTGFVAHTISNSKKRPDMAVFIVSGILSAWIADALIHVSNSQNIIGAGLQNMLIAISGAIAGMIMVTIIMKLVTVQSSNT